MATVAGGKERDREGAGGVRRGLVVGAGVSGCACAATAAARGVEVTLVNSALDAVGLPTFGPDMLAGAEGPAEITRALAGLPEVLRDVWASAILVAEGAPFVCVDRRMISIETKRALETMPGLELRQGLVSDLRLESSSRKSVGVGGGQGCVSVETVFGEMLRGRAVVVAVGLSLGGRVTVGEQVLDGGRNGEASADGLRVALERLGAKFGEVAVEVGPRFLADAVWRRGRGRVGGTRTAHGGIGGRGGVGRAVPLGRERPGDWSGVRWPAEYPPAPHWTDSLWAQEALVVMGKDGSVHPLLSPDGVATGEVHLTAGCNWSDVWGAADGGTRGRMPRIMACRPPQHVRGLMVTNLSPSGRLTVGGGDPEAIWVTGRASGAGGYLESLLTGVRTGIDLAAVVGAGG